MTIKAANPIEPIWYTPKSEEGSEKPTQFRIRGVNETQKGYLTPEFLTDKEGNLQNISGRGLELCMQWGLIDWRDFQRSDGSPINFSSKNLALIRYEMRMELAGKIIELSFLDEDERKNS